MGNWRRLLFLIRTYALNPIVPAFFVRKFAIAQAKKRRPEFVTRYIGMLAKVTISLIPASYQGVKQFASAAFKIEDQRIDELAKRITWTAVMLEVTSHLVNRHKTADQMYGFIRQNVKFNGRELVEQACRDYPDRCIWIGGFHMSNLSLLVGSVREAVPKERLLVMMMHSNAPGAFWEDNVKIGKEGEKKIEVIDIKNRIGLKRFLHLLKHHKPVFILMSDLSGGFGDATDCELFGRNMRFASGGVKLAHEHRMKVLNAYVTGIPYVEQVEINFVDPGISSMDDLPVTYERLRIGQQKIVNVFEKVLLTKPYYWHFWEWMSGYYEPHPLMKPKGSQPELSR